MYQHLQPRARRAESSMRFHPSPARVAPTLKLPAIVEDVRRGRKKERKKEKSNRTNEGRRPTAPTQSDVTHGRDEMRASMQGTIPSRPPAVGSSAGETGVVHSCTVLYHGLHGTYLLRRKKVRGGSDTSELNVEWKLKIIIHRLSAFYEESAKPCIEQGPEPTISPLPLNNHFDLRTKKQDTSEELSSDQPTECAILLCPHPRFRGPTKR